jgi:hypothetical protein
MDLTAIIYLVLVALALQAAVIVACAGHPALRRRRGTFQVIALAWSIMPIAKVYYFDTIIAPADSIEHEAIARDIAESLSSGRISDVTPYIAPGNSAYRLLLGVFYYVTGAPEIVVYAINGGLGLIGLLHLVDVLCRQTNCRRLPLFVVASIGLLPSALLWTTANLKEGAVLWGICAMLYFMLPARTLCGRTPRFLPFIGLIVVVSQRPHIAAAWLCAIGAGTALRTRRIGVFAGMGATAVACALLLSYVAPDLFSAAMSDGVSATLSERYQSLSTRENSGGSSLTGSTPIPVVSGILLVMFRPWPFEVEESHALLVGIEVWALAAMGFYFWKSTKQPWRLLARPAIATQIAALVMLGYYFSYMYNMGLVVRQRLMCFPAMLFIYFYPLLLKQGALVVKKRRRATSHASVHCAPRVPLKLQPTQ